MDTTGETGELRSFCQNADHSRVELIDLDSVSRAEYLTVRPRDSGDPIKQGQSKQISANGRNVSNNAEFTRKRGVVFYSTIIRHPLGCRRNQKISASSLTGRAAATIRVCARMHSKIQVPHCVQCALANQRVCVYIYISCRFILSPAMYVCTLILPLFAKQLVQRATIWTAESTAFLRRAEYFAA